MNLISETLSRWTERRNQGIGASPSIVRDLLALTNALASTGALEEQMESICVFTRRLLDCDRSSIFLLEGDRYYARFNAGNPPDVAAEFGSFSISVNDWIIEEAVAKQSAVCINDAARDPRFDRTMAERARIDAIVVAPIVDAEGGPLGFLTAEFNGRPLRFSADESELIGGIARVVALSMRRAAAEARASAVEVNLRTANRMAALGRFSGGIAHDLNNRLTVIMAIAEMLGGDSGDSAIQTDVAELVQAAEGASDLVKRLLVLSNSRLDGAPTTCDASEVAGAMRTLLRRSIAEDVDLDLRVEGPGLFVPVSRLDLERVLLNLVSNAGVACAPGGRVTVRVGSFERSAEAPEGARPSPTERCVFVRVSDDGRGIEAEELQRVFEPFHTTNRDGSGLGLSIVSAIAEAAGGRVRVSSKPGEGSHFTVELPQLGRARARPLAAGTGPVRGTRTRAATILLVDDDEAIRRHLRRGLMGRGHRVLEAASGRDALAVAEESEHRIDLLVTDVVMPELGGVELAVLLSRRDPLLRLILISGYAPESRSDQTGSLPPHRFLVKPFSLSQLLEEVDATLGRVAAAGGR